MSLPSLDQYSNLPTMSEIVDYLRQLDKPTTSQLLEKADRVGVQLLQPRCGVGSHSEMIKLLHDINLKSQPDILTLTIDSHTRLLDLSAAENALKQDSTRLNGYPGITHGFEKIREINETFDQPIQVRHGSPDGRHLFAVSVAGGITSYEGGGIGYNLPYCRKVPLEESLVCWRQIDESVGELKRAYDIDIERELFGTLTAVLMPPQISLSVLLLEAILAANVGCKVLSLAYPQGGNIIQDVAALNAIRALTKKYLPPDVRVYTVLHQFMGVFPKDRQLAESLIFLGGLTGKLGNATKIITKTYQEAIGIPIASINAAGVNQTRLASKSHFSALQVDSDLVEEELYWIEREVSEIIEPVLHHPNLEKSIVHNFSKGFLDIPFPANPDAKGDIFPVRDNKGAIRIAKFSKLPFSQQTKLRQQKLIADTSTSPLHTKVLDGIMYFT